MRIANLRATALFVGLLVPIGSAFAQHNFQRTITVDQSGNADRTTIHAAIADAGNNPTVKYTILVYAGTYTIDSVAKLIELDDTKENVDIVGIDRDSVIINVTIGDATTPRSGIKITSGTETSRNNAIRNLTIKTTFGHGIEIVKGGIPVPKDITIEGVTIHADGSGKVGVTGVLAENVSLTNCLVTSDDSHGMKVGDHWTLSQVTVETIEDTTFDQDALVVGNHTFLTVTDSTFIGEKRSISLQGAKDILVQNSRLTTSGAGGVMIASLAIGRDTKRVLFQSCLIVSDATLTMETRGSPRAVFLDDPMPTLFPVEDIVLQSCRIMAVGDCDSGSTTVVAVQHDIHGTLTLVDCEVSAINLKETIPAEARSLLKTINVANGIRVLGGVISSSSAVEKETEVWDVETVAGGVEISGTRLSKWKGPIASAERPRSVIQRTIDVSLADDDGILEATGLTGSEQPNVTPDFQPDVYRVLSVTGNKTGMFQTVYIIGTDWADNVITENIQLNETMLVEGVKPFKTVDHIILPAQNGAGETVTVGTTYKLGLYYPIASTSAVLQQGKKQSGATSYTLESIGPVDATYSTVEIVGLVAGGESFEWAILASQ